jgi:hypothetical protein
MKRFSLRMWMPRLAAVAALALAPATASADFLTADVTQFAVLGQFSNNQTNYNNGNIVGDIGIGSPRAFTISNASLTGDIRFSGAVNVSGLSGGPIPGPGPYTVSGGGTVTGGVFANDAVVATAINYTNDLSQALGGNAGTNTTVTSGGSINVSAGTLGTTASVDGNTLGTYRVFTVTSVNFPNGTFTINGSATDQVVLNIGANANLHGQILLGGGLIADHVLINMFGGNYTTHMGGPTLDVNTNGLPTFGIFLDPNGQMSGTHTDIQGRFFGGDTQNQQIVSGLNITAPTVTAVPVPPAFLLALSGVVTVGLLRLRRNSRRLEVAAA